MSSQSVELILARNLISSIQLAAVLVDPDGTVVFFNDTAGDLLGRRFDELGPLSREDWNSRFGPFDAEGAVLASEDMPLTGTLRTGLPVTARFHMRADGGELMEVEMSGLPLSGADGFKGALVAFWRADED